MKYIFFFAPLFFIACTLSSQAQKTRVDSGEVYAKKELHAALSGNIGHNVISPSEMILKDSETVIQVIEPILFGIYGKDNIISERPYKIFHINHYWVIFGTLPDGYSGGVFLVIINAKDARIVRLTHGK